MEPAVKPAAEHSRRGVVGVLGTPATLEGDLFLGTLERHATGVDVIRQPCPGLVERIEAGETQGPGLEELLRRLLRVPLEAGADVLVLACTHYPLVRETIERLAGPGVHVIDPAPAIARQLGRSLEGLQGVARGAQQGAEPATPGAERFATTGEPSRFETVAGAILGRPVRAAALGWSDLGTAAPRLRASETDSGKSKGAATATPFQDPPGLSS
jgi:glutamate racemase